MLSGKILPAKLVKASKYEEPLRGSQGRLTVKSNLGGGGSPGLSFGRLSICETGTGRQVFPTKNGKTGLISDFKAMALFPQNCVLPLAKCEAICRAGHHTSM